MLGALAAIVLPLAGANQLNLQVESGGVHLIAAAGIHTVSVRAAAGTPRPLVTRAGKTLIVLLTGHRTANVPFAQGTAPPSGYEIVYPAGVRIQVSELSGGITLDGQRAKATLETNAGPIVVNGAHGELDLAADTGDVTVMLAPDWRSSPLRMQSGNGALRLTVPPGFRAHVDAGTGAGAVHNALKNAARAKRPFVWLYTEKGDIWIATP